VSWAKLDDKLHSCPKRWKAGLEGVGLFTVCLSYAADHLTDGDVPRTWVHTQLEDSHEPLDAALAAGLLAEKNADEYTIPDYLKFNPSREQVEQRRQERAESGKRGGQKSAVSKAAAKQQLEQQLEQEVPPELAPTVQAKSNPVPVPVPRTTTTPPTPPQAGGRKRHRDQAGDRWSQWCESHFPGADPRCVREVATRARSAGLGNNAAALREYVVARPNFAYLLEPEEAVA
jgi:hypothetical protein